jgi:tetratricopeptide (TPR) repeat protein
MKINEKKLWTVNALLASTLIVLSLYYCNEINWAYRAIPDYIPSPEERNIYKNASMRISNQSSTEQDEIDLLRAVEIDPKSEASFWLAEYYRQNNRNTDALKHYLLFLEHDLSNPMAIIHVSRIFRAEGKEGSALDILNKGIAYQKALVLRGAPIYDGTVDESFNKKALASYRSAQIALEQLESELR